MIFNKFKKIYQYFKYFKNPLIVLAFQRGYFAKGKKVKIKPWLGSMFFVARFSDNWLINKVLNGKEVKTEEGYIVQDKIYLRQGTSDTFIYKEIFIDGCYKENVDKLTKDSVVIDLGAHIGLFSLYCATKCQKIYAYEPHYENYNLAVKNLKKVTNVNLFKLAVWSKSGEIVGLSDKGTQTGDHMLTKNVLDKRLQTKTTTLEEIFTKNNIDHCDLLKVDIEGAEYATLLNTPDFIFKKIKAVCLEFHNDLENKHSIEDLVKLFEKNEFEVKVDIKSPDCNAKGLLYAKK
jgi:FkbM family methyltransferase